ncbi:MAG TPA: cupin domain-containing protein [Actinomycetota bacterium]|nr:cupin domain-containing protein [Actinomycetota bacterium]
MTIDRSRLVSPAPGAVPASKAVLKLWGDERSGQVHDLIYVSNEKLQLMLFSMPPGGWFGHSEDHRTVLAADELYCVLRGTLVLANPETGEVHRIGRGEAISFGRDTWHHGFNHGTEPVEVLEFFAPPPATGTSQPYARTRPYLSESTYVRDAWLGRWPQSAKEARAEDTQHPVEDILWRLEGTDDPVLVGIYLSTSELTAGSLDVLPGQRSDPLVRGGDEAGYVVSGRMSLFLPEDPDPDGPGNGWHVVEAGDGWFVPAGMPHRYFNMGDEPVHALFGVAPGYLQSDG